MRYRIKANTLVRSMVLLCVALPTVGLPIISETSNRSHKSYTNPEYGYGVLFPENLNVKYPTPPHPNHGIKILINVDGTRYIWTDGSYNTMGLADLRQAAIANVRNENAQTQVVNAELGSLRAVRVKSRDCDTEIKSPTTCETITALRGAKNSPDVVYTIGLVTDENHASTDMGLFQSVVKSFMLHSLPK